MANKRIKDLATTATTTASGDFMAVDGTGNGTRKMSAATPAFLTSVTTPSLTAPALSPLTLGTGTSGAAITVLSASNNVGIGTITPLIKTNIVTTSELPTLGTASGHLMLGSDNNLWGVFLGLDNTAGGGWIQAMRRDSATAYKLLLNPVGGNVGIGTTTPLGKLQVQDSVAGFSALKLVNTNLADDGTTGTDIDFINDSTIANIGAKIRGVRVGGTDQMNLAFSTYGVDTFALSERIRITTTGNVLIGTTSSTGLTGAGGLKINSSTAGAASSGALVVTGGLATGAASYFGGAVTSLAAKMGTGFAGFAEFSHATGFGVAGTYALIQDSTGETYLNTATGKNLSLRVANANALVLTATTATFAGAVTANVTSSNYISIVSNATNKDAAFKSGDGTNNWYAGLVGGSFGTDGAYRILEQGLGTARVTIAPTTGNTTFAGTVIAPAATASLAPLRIPHGTVAPTSPTDGDMWTTTAGLFIRINGVTKTVTLT